MSGGLYSKLISSPLSHLDWKLEVSITVLFTIWETIKIELLPYYIHILCILITIGQAFVVKCPQFKNKNVFAVTF
jgi:nucleoside recognition membrane protein YjiH